jgi:hypothetical protein
MDWAVVEVVIGLSFMFFLMSIVASAANEAIAGIFKLRARSLEQGIKNLLTGSTKPPEGDLEIVRELYEHALVSGYGKGTGKNGPSYLSSRSFRNAFLDVTDLLEATATPAGDPIPVEEVRAAVQEKIDALPNQHLKDSLTAIWRSVNKDAAEFREGVERWFDRSMERVSGWYKRRAQLILFIVGLVVSIAINASALTAADRLWKENGFRKGLVAQVEHQQESTTGTDALGRLEDLGFPIGWEEANRPDDLGAWLLAFLGWLITGLAVTLGAPFWFDALGKVSNLRTAGVKPASSLPPASSTKEVGEVTLNIESP